MKKFFLAAKKSHKGDNGIITIIAGSRQYHGSALLAIKIAAKIVDLIYFYSPLENQRLIRRLKEKSCLFINIQKNINQYLKRSDAILIGPGLEINKKNKILVNKILKLFKNKKIILDAGALRMVDKKLLNNNIVLTPHAGEFESLFSLAAKAKNAQKMAKKYHCAIVLKGAKDVVCNFGKMYYNIGGNPGLTKGGTGDVLAGLISALAAKNDLFTAAFCGSFFNKKAAEKIGKKVGNYYDAEDLIKQLPKTMNNYIKFRYHEKK